MTDPQRTDRNGAGEEPRSAWAEALRISDLGLRLVFSVGALVAIGLWLDRRLDLMRFPVFAVVGAILGFTVGMIALVRGLTAAPRRKILAAGAPADREPAKGDGSKRSLDSPEATTDRGEDLGTDKPSRGERGPSGAGSGSEFGRRDE